MQSYFNFPSPEAVPSDTLFWDVFDTALQTYGPFDLEDVMDFFAAANRFTEARRELTHDYAAVGEAQIDFFQRFFEKYQDDGEFLNRIGSSGRVELREFLWGAYIAAKQFVCDYDFVELMNDLADAYSFEIPSDEDIHRKLVVFSERIPIPSKEVLEIEKGILDNIVAKRVPFFLVSVRDGERPLTVIFNAEDYDNKDRSPEAEVTHAIVNAVRKSGRLLVDTFLRNYHRAMSFRSVNGDVSLMEDAEFYPFADAYVKEIWKDAQIAQTHDWSLLAFSDIPGKYLTGC